MANWSCSLEMIILAISDCDCAYPQTKSCDLLTKKKKKNELRHAGCRNVVDRVGISFHVLEWNYYYQNVKSFEFVFLCSLNLLRLLCGPVAIELELRERCERERVDVENMIWPQLNFIQTFEVPINVVFRFREKLFTVWQPQPHRTKKCCCCVLLSHREKEEIGSE